jgi:phosphoribosylformylglycinamidine cyclo-ligase
LHGDRVSAGDHVIGFASTGLHTNGYTLARKIVFDTMRLGIDDPFPETTQSVGQVLLAVHRSYAAALRPVLAGVHALAHVTGGGIAGNLVRVLPPNVEAVVDAGSWPWPSVFRVLMRSGQIGRDEMRRVFNLGVGMIAVSARDAVETVVRAAERAHVQAWIIGEIRPARNGAPPAVRFEER